MQKRNKIKVAAVLVAAMLTTSLSGVSEMEAAKKATVSVKSMKIVAGAKKTIVIKNRKKGAKYLFATSKKSVAKVSTKGVVTGVKQGTATITVKEKVVKKTRKVGAVKVTVMAKKKVDNTADTTPVVTESAVPSQSPESTVAPDSTPVVSGAPTVTPAATTTPAATVDPYTKELFQMTLKDGIFEEVKGATCTVGMQYFTAEVSGTYFNGKTLNEGSNVRKAYKDGTITSCAKFILKGQDNQGEECSVFIQDEAVEKDGAITTTPIIVTDSESMEWMETADIQGRVSMNEAGNPVVTYYWNESNTEKKNPPAVKMPDTSRNYNQELFTFSIKTGKTDKVSSESEARAQMIHFTGSSDCANFKGNIVADCVDTRLQYPGMIQTLSARYILDGVDAKGNPCRIYVENNGIDTGEMVTEPQIITDCPDYAWIESAPLHGTVSWETGLTIHMWTTKDGK